MLDCPCVCVLCVCVCVCVCSLCLVGASGQAFFTPSLTISTPDDGASGIVVAYSTCEGQVG
jgi:hypothetical protein